MVLFILFFFKQKTAYDMRISDWSSDVCSSDLGVQEEPHQDLDARLGRDQSSKRCESVHLSISFCYLERYWKLSWLSNWRDALRRMTGEAELEGVATRRRTERAST